jgi:hypothetical protein
MPLVYAVPMTSAPFAMRTSAFGQPYYPGQHTSGGYVQPNYPGQHTSGGYVQPYYPGQHTSGYYDTAHTAGFSDWDNYVPGNTFLGSDSLAHRLLLPPAAVFGLGVAGWGANLGYRTLVGPAGDTSKS